MSSERDDAAVVYRWLRATTLEGGTGVDEIAFQCFPLPIEGGPDSTMSALRKRSVRRVLEALVWMRGSGVLVLALPARGDGLTRFVLKIS